MNNESARTRMLVAVYSGQVKSEADLRLYAEAIRSEALEEAAKVCEAEAKNYPIHDDIARGCDYCAEAIRALMKPKPQGGSFP